jgi:hypothetical protein
MNENVFKALGIFLETMRPYVVSVLQKYYPNEPWEGVLYAKLSADKQAAWNRNAKEIQKTKAPSLGLIDFSNLTSFAFSFKDLLVKEFGEAKQANKFISCVQELEDTRNKCQHYQPIDEDETIRTFGNIKLVARLIGDEDLYDEVTRISAPKAKPVEQPVVKPVQVQSESVIDENSQVTPWFANVIPHYDISRAILDESIFAANLGDVAMGTAPEVYTNSASFFEKTYVTHGLRDIATRVVTALNGGVTENRVISLKTGFGGGKTHTLITLYHIVKCGTKMASMESCRDLLKNGLVPEFDNAKVAVFTNNTTDVAQGRQTEEGITINTIWGEIAYQLGGVEAYNRIAENDRDRIAPSSGVFQPILEATKPAMILIDELADYCVKASAKKVGVGNLYSQTLSFVQTLTEMVASVPQSLLIVTLPESIIEVASSDIGQNILTSLEQRVIRVGSAIKPIDDEEVFEVVRRRLFDEIIDQNVVEQVVRRYQRMYHNRYNDLPAQSDNNAYAEKMRKSYPFHPELIDMFRLRWGSDPHFQRTRGVLRLLASIVQDLWRRRQNLTGTQALIHTSDINLENLPTLTGLITDLMGSQWEAVMQADVYGSASNAFKIDSNELGSNIGQFNLTQGIANTILLASIGTPTNNGITIKELKLCMLKPNAFNHNDIDGALNKYEQVAHYLHYSNIGEKRYWFHSKPNINIILNQAKTEISNDEIRAEIVKRLKNSCAFITDPKTLIAPTSDIPEQKALTLVVLDPIYAVPIDRLSPTVETYVKNNALKRGDTDRLYRNTMLYLVCSEQGKGNLDLKIREYLGCVKVQNVYAASIERDQRDEIQKRREAFDKDAYAALVQAYAVVLRYTFGEGFLRYDVKNYASDFSSQIMQNIMGELKEEEWILDSIGRGILSKHNLLPTLDNPIRVRDFYEAFLKFDDKPMISGSEAVIQTVNRYCSEGLFNVASGEAGKYETVYSHTKVPFLNVNDEDYWLVDVSVKKEESTPPPGNGSGNEGGSGTGNETGNGGGTKPEPPTPPAGAKQYRKIKISGTIAKEQWTQLWMSFLVPLKDNGLHISVEFEAQTTDKNPLDENSHTVKCVKESAAQLGLSFDAEEK